MESTVGITSSLRQQIRSARDEAKRTAIDLVSIGERKCRGCGCYLDCYTPNCGHCKNRKSKAKRRNV